MCVKTLACSAKKEHKTLVLEEDTENKFVISRRLYSVTAGTPEEEERKAEILKTIDVDLVALIQTFPRLFEPPDSIPPERSIKHHIHLKPNAAPVRRAPYMVGREKLQAMREQVRQLQR